MSYLSTLFDALAPNMLTSYMITHSRPGGWLGDVERQRAAVPGPAGVLQVIDKQIAPSGARCDALLRSCTRTCGAGRADARKHERETRSSSFFSCDKFPYSYKGYPCLDTVQELFFSCLPSRKEKWQKLPNSEEVREGSV